jgi:hypothetical protein
MYPPHTAVLAAVAAPERPTAPATTGCATRCCARGWRCSALRAALAVDAPKRAAPPELEPPPRLASDHLEATMPGELVQLDW